MGSSNAGDCFAKTGARKPKFPVTAQTRWRSDSTAWTVGSTPRVVDGPVEPTRSRSYDRTGSLPFGTRKDIDKVVSCLRQVAGPSSIAR
jgi:hypothetical protein